MKIRAAVLDRMGAEPPYKKSKPLRIAELELDPPGRGEILVRVAAAGLCHSDLSVINGDRPRPMPMALGHESAGVVEELGEDVTDLKVGDHVVMVFMPSCGHCVPVRGGPARAVRARRGRRTAPARCCPARGGCIATARRSTTISACPALPRTAWCRAARW